MTHRELLNKLPSPIGEQAIENIKETRGIDFLDNNCHYTIDSVLTAFRWSGSKQGTDYWVLIHKRAKAGEFDDPSVILPREDWDVLYKCIAAIIEDPESWKGVEDEKRILEAISSQLNQAK